jgi:hypothetical protein
MTRPLVMGQVEVKAVVDAVVDAHDLNLGASVGHGIQ